MHAAATVLSPGKLYYKSSLAFGAGARDHANMRFNSNNHAQAYLRRLYCLSISLCCTASLSSLSGIGGCADPGCPMGTKERSGHCILLADAEAGTMTSSVSTEPDPVAGGATGSSADASMPSDKPMSRRAGMTGQAQPMPGSSGAGGAGAPPESKPLCGDGMVEAGELCEGASCPSECKSSNACLVVTLMGSPATCDARCSEPVRVAECANGDGCCAEGCVNANDSDCSKNCGDGVVDSPESCEPTSQTQPCPTSCDDGMPSTLDILTGTVQQCSAECAHMPITTPKNGDDYCPPGANANNDNDCSPTCGNKVKESGELCDGNCPTTCPKPSDTCTISEPKGTGCQIMCVERKLTASKSTKDGCCPPSANANTDSDCAAECGNGVTEPGEMCDANCPQGCTDSGQCSIGQLEGAGTCNARCVSMTVRASGTTKDGRCCGQNGAEDADCPSKCGNGILEPGEACDLGARAPEGYTYDSWSCNSCTRLHPMAPCSNVSDCGPNAISCTTTTAGLCVAIRCTPNPNQDDADPNASDCTFPNGTRGRCINTDNCAPMCKTSADCPSHVECVMFGTIGLCNF